VTVEPDGQEKVAQDVGLDDVVGMALARRGHARLVIENIGGGLVPARWRTDGDLWGEQVAAAMLPVLVEVARTAAGRPADGPRALGLTAEYLGVLVARLLDGPDRD